LENAEK